MLFNNLMLLNCIDYLMLPYIIIHVYVNVYQPFRVSTMMIFVIYFLLLNVSFHLKNEFVCANKHYSNCFFNENLEKKNNAKKDINLSEIN